MAQDSKFEYEPIGLRAVRPYLIVGNADEAIDFYRRVFEASELERHVTPTGGVATQNCRSARRLSRLESTQMPTGESLTVYRESDSACTSQMSMGPMNVRWMLAPRGTLPQIACRAHVQRASTTRTASPGGL